MNVHTKVTRMEPTQAILAYVEKKTAGFSKFLAADAKIADVHVEVEKTTRHHHSGPVFRAEVNLSAGKTRLYADATADDLYAAIDLVRNEVVRELTALRSKRRALERRGSLRIKKMMKGGK